MSVFSRALALAAACLVATVVSAAAHDASVGSIAIKDPWARATPPAAKVAGGFMRLENTGTEPDRLVGGTVTFADRVEVHEMAMEGDVMKMRQLADGLEIPAGGAIELKPGSFHVMFIGLKQGLKEGGVVNVNLTFEKAGSVDVMFHIQALGAMGNDAEPMKHDAHGTMNHGG